MENHGKTVKTVFLPHVPTRYDPVTRNRVPVLDLTPAAKFGPFIVINPPEERAEPDRIAAMIKRIADSIATMRADDYILAVGDPILIAAAISYGCAQHGSVRVLRWDRRDHQYQTVEVRL